MSSLRELSLSNLYATKPFESNKVDISDLPNLAGYGAVQSLHQVIELDTGGVLKELVENFVEASGDEKVLLTHEILYYWTTNKPSVSTNINNINNSEKFEIIKVLYGKNEEWKNWSYWDIQAKQTALLHKGLKG